MLDHVINNVREEPIECLQCCVDVNDRSIAVNKLKNQVEQVLPNLFILFEHGSLNFNEQIAHLMHIVPVVHILDRFE